jgi:hypothetical protein
MGWWVRGRKHSAVRFRRCEWRFRKIGEKLDHLGAVLEAVLGVN